MNQTGNRHIKCTIREEAPLFESYIYFVGNPTELTDYLSDSDRALLADIPPASYSEALKEIISSRGKTLLSTEFLGEKNFYSDLAATRADGLPYIILGSGYPLSNIG